MSVYSNLFHKMTAEGQHGSVFGSGSPQWGVDFMMQAVSQPARAEGFAMWIEKRPAFQLLWGSMKLKILLVLFPHLTIFILTRPALPGSEGLCRCEYRFSRTKTRANLKDYNFVSHLERTLNLCYLDTGTAIFTKVL